MHLIISSPKTASEKAGPSVKMAVRISAGVIQCRTTVGNIGQKGSLLIVTLLVLVVVTVLGLISLYRSSIERTIAVNARDNRELFYLADGVATEGLQKLSDVDSVDLEETIRVWHHAQKQIVGEGINFREASDWIVSSDDRANCANSLFHPDGYFAAVESRVATGGSLLATQSRLYLNRVYGLCMRKGAYHIIEVGYYSRYGGVR